MPGRKILVNDVRVRGTGKSQIPEETEMPRVTKEPIAQKVAIIFAFST